MDRDSSNKKGRGQSTDKKYSQSSVDAGVYTKLETIIGVLHDDTSKSNSGKDFKPLVEFCHKGFLNQMVQSWSYYAQVNNHAMFAKSTMILVKTVRLINQNKSIIEFGDQLIRLLLTDYLKVIYRGLNNLRGQITNPMLFLLKEIILFDDCKHIEDFLSFFDFTLPSLVKIVTPTKQELEGTNNNNNGSTKTHKSLRLSFIEFWIELINKTPSLLRKDFLVDNFKIMSAWFKYMDKVDSSNIMLRTVNMFINSILNEKSFKRMTKTKILNEFALAKLHHFYYSNNKDLVTKINEFFLAYGSNPESAVSFPDNCVWFEESPMSGGFAASASHGAPVTINQREFKLYNKLLFNVLRLFKPWEDDMQSVTLTKILKANPGLVAPYCAYIDSLGSHDPKMTSYWFGLTLLLGRIINLPIPTFMENIETDIVPSTTLVMENIFPSSLTKVSLTKTLQNDVSVIKYLGSQLLVFAFQKLQKVLDLYDRKGWNSSKASLNTLFFNNIPDLSIIVNTLNQVYSNHKENQTLLLSLTLILRHYSNCFPNFFAVTLPSANIYQDIMRKDSFNGMELTILDNFLQFQEFNNSTQTKWWNSSGTESSLFVSLLKLASSPNTDGVTSWKIARLLQSLLNGSVIFREDLLIHPVTNMVSSLKIVSHHSQNSPEKLASIWKLVDQCISRSIKTPYKYVTLAQGYENSSPYLMTLAEQWKFVDQSKLDKEEFDLTSKWILIFFRNMIIGGENQDGLQKVVKEYMANIPESYISTYLNFNTSQVTELNKEVYLLNESTESSYFYYINLLDYKKLKNVTRLPVNDMDLVGILSKIKLLSFDKDIKFDTQFKDSVVALFTPIVNYVSTNKTFTVNDIKIYSTFFESILEQISDNGSSLLDKTIFIAQQLLLVFTELKEKSTELETFLFDWIDKIMKTGPKDDNKELLLLISLASTFVNVGDALSLINTDFIFDRNTISIMFSKIAQETQYQIEYTVLEKYLENAEESIESFNTLIENGQIANINIKSLIPLCIKNSNMTTIFNSLLSSGLIQETDIVPFLDKIKDRSISISIVKVFDNVASHDAKFTEFSKKIIDDCYNKLKDLTGNDFNNTVDIFTHNSELLSGEQIKAILTYITTEYEHKFSDVVIDFVGKHASMEEDFIVRWLNKMTLYVTKIFSDRTELNSKFDAVLGSFKDFVSKYNIWDKVNNNIINSQLEAIFQGTWINDIKVINYALLVIFSAKSGNVETEKIINFIVNNEHSPMVKDDTSNELKYLVTLSLYTLFNIEPTKCSNIILQNKLVSFYNGSMDASDKLILKVLEVIEVNLSSSWTNFIYAWDLLESNEADLELIGKTKLFTQEKEGLVLTLRKDQIEYSIKNYILDYPSIPQLATKSNVSASDKISSFKLYFNEFSRISSARENRAVYDPLFLILLTIHNKELVSTTKTEENGDLQYKFNLKNFISSKLLNFIICALADIHNKVNEISIVLLTQILYSLEENSQFKNDNIYKILLKKIIFTIEKSKQPATEGNVHEISPIMWFFVSSVCDVLNQPSSQLYEKAFRWILNGPMIRNGDLPLLHEIMSPKYSEHINETYYSQLSWVLTNLEAGVRTVKDFDFLKRRGIIEWLFTLLNNPYLNARLTSKVKSIFYKIQRIESGASVLITRYAALSNLDMSTFMLNEDLQLMNKQLEKNSKNTHTIKKKFTISEQLLNNKELMSGYAEIIQSNKRLREWTEDESENLRKRISQSQD